MKQEVLKYIIRNIQVTVGAAFLSFICIIHCSKFKIKIYSKKNEDI
jgi:hypothetical protein